MVVALASVTFYRGGARQDGKVTPGDAPTIVPNDGGLQPGAWCFATFQLALNLH